jgi:hypothetical protein
MLSLLSRRLRSAAAPPLRRLSSTAAASAVPKPVVDAAPAASQQAASNQWEPEFPAEASAQQVNTDSREGDRGDDEEARREGETDC